LTNEHLHPSLLDGAQRATGTIAVIDVFRAFTTAAVALANGANRIGMVSSVEEALTLRATRGMGQICMCEVRADEDEVCAIHLRNRLEGRPSDRQAVHRPILMGGEVAPFHGPARPHLHPEYVGIAIDINRFVSAIRMRIEEGRPVGRVVPPD
jgi:hypothetical protein